MFDHGHRLSPHQPTKRRQGGRLLVYVGALAVREVVVAFYPDVLDVSLAAGHGGSAGTERTGEQVLHLLQLEALRLWEAAQDEDQAQGHQARVHEEGP